MLAIARNVRARGCAIAVKKMPRSTPRPIGIVMHASPSVQIGVDVSGAIATEDLMRGSALEKSGAAPHMPVIVKAVPNTGFVHSVVLLWLAVLAVIYRVLVQCVLLRLQCLVLALIVLLILERHAPSLVIFPLLTAIAMHARPCGVAPVFSAAAGTIEMHLNATSTFFGESVACCGLAWPRIYA